MSKSFILKSNIKYMLSFIKMGFDSSCNNIYLIKRDYMYTVIYTYSISSVNIDSFKITKDTINFYSVFHLYKN